MSTINSPVNTVPALQNQPVQIAQTQPTTITSADDIVIPAPEEKGNKSNLLAATLTGLGLIGIGSYLFYTLRKGKGVPEKTIEMFKKEGNFFERGIAKTKDGNLFSGKLTQTTQNGDKVERYYVNGQLEKAAKNVDEKGFYDPTKAVNYTKIYNYNSEGKISSISQITGVDGEAIYTEIIKPIILKADDFAAQGGKFVEGKALKADDIPYTGIIVEQKGTDRLLKEYRDGKLVSERLNTTLKDNVTKPDGNHYIRNEEELDKMAEEAKNPLNRIRNFFKDLFVKMKQTKKTSSENS